MFYFNFHSNENSSFPFRITFKPAAPRNDTDRRIGNVYHKKSVEVSLWKWLSKTAFPQYFSPSRQRFFIYSLQAVTGLRHQYPFHTRGRLNRVAHRIFSDTLTSYSNCTYFFIYARTTRISPSRQNRCGGNHASRREQQYMASLIQPCITS